MKIVIVMHFQKISPSEKVFLLFLALNQIIRCQDDHSDSADHESHGELLTESQIWGFGFLGGLSVSIIGFLAAIIVVCIKKYGNETCFEVIIKFLFALACGALLGDTLVHILPQAYTSNDTQSQFVALVFIFSLVFFLNLERIFQRCGVSHSHWHSQQPKQKLNSRRIVNEETMKQNDEDNVKKQQKKQEDSETREKGICENLSGKGSAGYLNLIGSLIHNLVDGLAVGVAFATGDPDEIVGVMVAVIAHEIPREMGDVAILMKNDFSSTQTILCNGLINLISLVGVFIGLGVTNLDDGAKLYLLVFVAGNFVYIAADIWRNLLKNNPLWKNILQFFGFAMGVGAMYLVSLAESEENHRH